MKNYACDYNMGSCPEILEALCNANSEQFATYGFDALSDRAKEKIRLAIENPEADIYFLIGGTQTNAIALSYLLRPWEGALCAETGHIAVHEAGAVEAGGHKVLAVKGNPDGKISIPALRAWLETFALDGSNAHMVQPGAVYISQPTEFGGVYCREELTELREICDRYGLRLYADGARLAYALGSVGNDVSLPVLASLCDAFYIGGTKCGALFGEALVFPKKEEPFFTFRKQNGALLAKGWLLGLQFDVLFTDGLYERLGRNAIDCAGCLRERLEAKGVSFAVDSPTNQQFLRVKNSELTALSQRIGYEMWELGEESSVIRVCTSWKTNEDDLNEIVRAFE